MPKNEFLSDGLFYLLLFLSTLAFLYWVSLANYNYHTFQNGYFDLGVFSYSMYWHSHSFMSLLGPQYLVFAGHLSLFAVLLVPIFYLFNNPLILVVIQDLFLVLAVLMAYVAAKKTLGSRMIAFAIGFALLINPGMMGLFLFDFHLEAFITFFFILTFYFYIQAKRNYFIMSLILLLSTIEVAPVLGFSMMFGLLFYELVHRRESDKGSAAQKKERERLILAGFLLSALFLILYAGLEVYLTNMFASIPYSVVPPPLRQANILFLQTQISSSQSALQNEYYRSPALARFLPSGILIYLFGFGPAILISPLIGLIMTSPFFGEVLVMQNYRFLVPNWQYYAYMLGGSVVSVILCVEILFRNGIGILRIPRIDWKKYEIHISSSIAFGAFYISMAALIATFPLSVLTFASAHNLNYTQISNEIALLPRNASVMAQSSIATHLFSIRELELSPQESNQTVELFNFRTYWFTPDYIVTDENVSNYTAGNYATYYNYSGIYIFKRIATNQT